MTANSVDVMQAAIDHATRRTVEIKADYESQGKSFYGTAAGWVEASIGTVKVTFVQADSRVNMRRYKARKVWYLNDKRISRDNLVKQLNAA